MLICKKTGYIIKPMRSAAGYYLGTQNENGESYCRVSGYCKTEKEAETLGCTRIGCIENLDCSDGKGCFYWLQLK